MRKRSPIADYDQRYDTVRAVFTVTCEDTGRGVRVGHLLSPQPQGTVEARKQIAKRVAGALLQAIGPEPVSVAAIRRVLNTSLTADLLAVIRRGGGGALRHMFSPDEGTVASHFEHVYQPALSGKPDWRSRQLGMMRKNVWRIRMPGTSRRLEEMRPTELGEEHCRAVKLTVMGLDRTNKTQVEIWRTYADYVNALHRHDDPRIRLRTGLPNPLENVTNIRKTRRPEKQYLLIQEAWALFECTEVLREWQRFFAVTILLGLRVSETKGLEAGDLRGDLIRVTRKIIWDKTKAAWVVEDFTKSKTVRWVKVPQNLRPLIDALCRRAPQGSLFPSLVAEHHPATILRRALLAAEVTRSELHASHTGSNRITAHDLRATCATWLYQRGWDMNDVRRQLGHTDTATTETYIRERVSFDQKAVDPLSEPLPSRLFEGLPARPKASGQSSGDSVSGAEPPEKCLFGAAPAVGLEPASQTNSRQKRVSSDDSQHVPTRSDQLPDDSPDDWGESDQASETRQSKTQNQPRAGSEPDR